MPSNLAVDPAPAREAPFGTTAALVAMAAVVVLSQLYGAIALFSPMQVAFGLQAGEVASVQTAFGIAYAVGFIAGPMIALYTAVGTSGLIDGGTLLVLRASALPALVWGPFGSRWLGRYAPQHRLMAAFVIAGIAAVAVAVAVAPTERGLGRGRDVPRRRIGRRRRPGDGPDPHRVRARSERFSYRALRLLPVPRGKHRSLPRSGRCRHAPIHRDRRWIRLRSCHLTRTARPSTHPRLTLVF